MVSIKYLLLFNGIMSTGQENILFKLCQYRLPPELKREIIKFVDYDTKCYILLDMNPRVLNERYLSSILNVKQGHKLYRNAVRYKLYCNVSEVEPDVSRYISSEQKLQMKDDIIKTLPPSEIITFKDFDGEIATLRHEHPILRVLKNKISYNRDYSLSLLSTYKSLSNIRTIEHIDFNYYIAKQAYQLLATTIIYCNTVKNYRINQYNLSMKIRDEKKAIKDKDELQKKISNTKQYVETIQTPDNENRLYSLKLRRTTTRLEEYEKTMMYINEGMTFKEAKSKYIDERNNILKEEQQNKLQEKNKIKLQREILSQKKKINNAIKATVKAAKKRNKNIQQGRTIIRTGRKMVISVKKRILIKE